MRWLIFTFVLTALLLPATKPVAAQTTPQEVRVNFLNQGEPDSLDPNRASFKFASEAAVVRQVFEPLLRFDENLVPQPAAAESYDVSLDGTVYTFHLRQDGQWSDGQPVTAQQFEYSWKRILDPRLKAEYAPLFIDAGIIGADDYNARRTASADKVGVRAIDDYTLEIRLAQPFGALPDLAALWVASPIRPELVAADPDGWAQDPSTYLGVAAAGPHHARAQSAVHRALDLGQANAEQSDDPDGHQPRGRPGRLQEGRAGLGTRARRRDQPGIERPRPGTSGAAVHRADDVLAAAQHRKTTARQRPGPPRAGQGHRSRRHGAGPGDRRQQTHDEHHSARHARLPGRSRS